MEETWEPHSNAALLFGDDGCLVSVRLFHLRATELVARFLCAEIMHIKEIDLFA